MSTTDRPVQRRAVIAGGGAVVAALAAACSSDPTPATTPPTRSSAAGSAAPGSAAAGGAAPLAAVTDVPDGGSLVANGVLLARAGDAVTGRSPVCTHAQCTVAAAGAEADCPCHGSRFNATTGAVLNGPATEPLPEIAVTVKNGNIFPA